MKKIKILKIIEKLCLIFETDLVGFEFGMLTVAHHFDLELPNYWSIVCACIFTVLVLTELICSFMADKLNVKNIEEIR